MHRQTSNDTGPRPLRPMEFIATPPEHMSLPQEVHPPSLGQQEEVWDRYLRELAKGTGHKYVWYDRLGPLIDSLHQDLAAHSEMLKRTKNTIKHMIAERAVIESFKDPNQATVRDLISIKIASLTNVAHAQAAHVQDLADVLENMQTLGRIGPRQSGKECCYPDHQSVC